MGNVIYLECDSDKYIGDSVDRKYDEYNLDDVVLVRATDIFPFDRVVETPIHGNAYGFDDSHILGEAIKDVLREIYNGDELLEQIKKFEVCFETLRSTIHFTINGLVSSHMYGNFDGRPYVIIEPLKHHIDEKSLCSLNACDTYFNDDIKLSNDAVLLITEDKFNEIKNDSRYSDDLLKFKIYVWRGNNQNEALKNVLKYLGYDYFVVNNHGYVNGLESKMAAGKMWLFLDKIRTSYEIGGDSHYYSSFNENDIANRWELSKKIDMDHLQYLLDRSNVSIEIVDKIKRYKESGVFDDFNFYDMYKNNEWGIKDTLIGLINKIGLENLERLTKEFNDKYIDALKQSKGKIR